MAPCMSLSPFKSLFPLIALLVSMFLSPLSASAEGTPYGVISFDSAEMAEFNRPFKSFIAAVKRCPDRQAALRFGAQMKRAWKVFEAKASSGLDDRARADLAAVAALLHLAVARADQGEMGEALETTIRVRTELYLLHERLGLLSSEDHMIYFHNGILHRLEPMVQEGRFQELEQMLPRMEGSLRLFSVPPAYADESAYGKRYEVLKKAAQDFAAAARRAARYVDPEGGKALLKRAMLRAFNHLHSAFGALYLGFPSGVPSPVSFCGR